MGYSYPPLSENARQLLDHFMSFRAMPSKDKKMLFSAVNPGTPLFSQPALFIVGENADSRHQSENI